MPPLWSSQAHSSPIHLLLKPFVCVGQLVYVKGGGKELKHLVYVPDTMINLLFTQAGEKPLPNTGVFTWLSMRGVPVVVSICVFWLNSLFTAIRASGFVNKKPNSQNAAGPTLPWKQTKTHMRRMMIRSLTLALHSDSAGGYLVTANKNITRQPEYLHNLLLKW